MTDKSLLENKMIVHKRGLTQRAAVISLGNSWSGACLENAGKTPF